ncbi:hypothetical protein IM944_003986 [Shigella flexneri]|nr:hypothetical protein [Shigella flexneri]EHK0690910.1 hypothetical protein [Escherichia coli]QGK14919.1 hypothetical protein GJE14_25025 [Shigella flexneri 2a]EFV6214023.1 hypothetical protein [Shigella flexneri]EFV7625226.1 hypothetical protein [Shigella flexneri]
MISFHENTQAELITGKLYDRIPKEIWKYVR